MKIANFEELIQYTSDVLAGTQPYEPVTFTTSSLTTTFRVCGDSWNKSIDIRHAYYILTLQSTLDSLLSENRPDLEGLIEPKVRAELTEGSSELTPDLIDFAKLLVGNMNDTQTFICSVIAILSAVGYLGLSKWLEHKAALHEQDLSQEALTTHEETKRQLLAPLRKEVERDPQKFAQYERPVAKLLSLMGENDSLALDKTTPIPTTEAKKIFRTKRSRSDRQMSCCDGDFLLTKIDYSQGEMIIYLEQDGYKLKTYTNVLDTIEKEKLFNEIKERQLDNEFPFLLQLQVNVEHTERSIVLGIVVGLGAPRPDKNITTLGKLITN